MDHAVIIMEDGRFLVAIRIPSSIAYMMDYEIDKILDQYAEDYSYERKGLKGYYMPLIDLINLPKIQHYD
jgi:hypothetical protein